MFTPPILDVAWSRQIGLVYNANTSAIVVFDPTCNLGGSTALYGLGPSAFLTVVPLANALTIANTALAYYFPPTDYARIASISSSLRPSTAAVRLTVRYPATSAPGRLYALNVCDAIQNIAAMSASQLASLDCAHPIAFDGSGVAIIQGNWRQQNQLDFNMSVTAVPDTNLIISTKTILVALGWPGGFNIDVEAIAHLEIDSGVLQSAPSPDDIATLAMSSPIEVVAAALRRLPTQLDRSALQVCQSLQLTSAMRSSVSSRRNRPMQSAYEQEYVDLSSTAGEFVSGMGQTVRDSMPSAASLGAAAGSILFGAAVNHARLRN
jgi:hypothetical protein